MSKYFDDKLVIGIQPGEYSIEEFRTFDHTYSFKNGNAKFILYYAGKKIEDYVDFLNEARLSAFTLCFRLAAIRLLPAGPSDHRLLFLDDVFTGLDMSNRLPLLKLIRDEFIELEVAPFQVGIATHDRSWYELIERWFKQEKVPIKTIEMYVRPGVGLKEPDVPVVLDRSSDPFDQALAHFAIGDYPACAVNLRKAAERVAKGFVPKNQHSRNHPDGSQQPRDLAELMDEAKNRLYDHFDNPSLFDRFSRIRHRILNPYAHDDATAPFFRREVAEAIDVLRELRRYSVIRLAEAADGLQATHTYKDRTAVIVFEENLEALHKDSIQIAVLRANCRCDNALRHSENIQQAVKYAWSKTHKGEKVADPETVYDQFLLADGRTLSQLLNNSTLTS